MNDVRIWLNIIKLVSEPVVTYFIIFYGLPFHKHLCFTRVRTFNIISLIYGIKWLIAHSSFLSLWLFWWFIKRRTWFITQCWTCSVCNCSKKRNEKILMRYRSSTIIIMYFIWSWCILSLKPPPPTMTILCYIVDILSLVQERKVRKTCDSLDAFASPPRFCFTINWMKIMCTFGVFPNQWNWNGVANEMNETQEKFPILLFLGGCNSYRFSRPSANNKSSLTRETFSHHCKCRLCFSLRKKKKRFCFRDRKKGWEKLQFWNACTWSLVFNAFQFVSPLKLKCIYFLMVFN